jgi:hypothetical protein
MSAVSPTPGSHQSQIEGEASTHRFATGVTNDCNGETILNGTMHFYLCYRR